MKWFKATTESGTEYFHDPDQGSLVYITSNKNTGLGSQTISAGYMTVIPPEQEALWDVSKKIDWKWIQDNADKHEVPVVGSRLAVVGIREWRISTRIAKVEEK